MKKRSSQDGSIRYLILDPVAGWQIYPAQQVLATFNGDHRLPEFAGCTIKFVSAQIHQTADGLVTLTRLEASDWCFDADGKVDQARQWAGILRQIDPADESGTVDQVRIDADDSITTPNSSLAMSASDIRGICKVIGITG